MLLQRASVTLTMALAALLAFPTISVAQTAKARATAKVDLEARFKEVMADPQLADTLYKNGRKVAAVCSNCHGEGGNSTISTVPNLAGQNPAYLLEQVRLFAVGKRRNEFMEGIIRAMESDEKIGMVLFYAAQEVTHKPAANPEIVAKGQALFNSICFKCHGNAGRGSEQVARIAGQQADYVRLTLKGYRDGSIARPNSIMTPNVKQLSNTDVEAIVAYVSSMP